MKALETYTRNLTKIAKTKKVDGAFGRTKELQTLQQIMLRRQKGNAILVGKAGVGKTAIVEEFAKNIVDQKVHYELEDYTILELDVNSLIAGSRERGELEKRAKELVEELNNMENVILMIDEIHNIASSVKGDKNSNMLNISEILKPALARGNLKCIGATTLDEYMKLMSDKALDRRFTPIYVEEPSNSETKEILKSVKYVYEKYHDCVYMDDALDTCVDLSDKYIHYRNFPDKAIDLVDELGSYTAGLKHKTIVTKEDVLDFVSTFLGIPRESMTQNSMEKIINIEKLLKGSIIGQDDAIDLVCRTLMRKECGLYDEKRPIASFLFFGDSSTGKTTIAKMLGELYCQNTIKLDMSEYMEKHTVSKLIGSPPGYVGYDEGGKLTNAVKRKPHSLIIFDEIEKAHPDIANIMLQMLEDGIVTDSNGNTVNFNQCIIILTSNLGSSVNKTNIGFMKEEFEEHDSASYEELKSYFRPEMLNRVDNIVNFKALDKAQLTKVCEIKIDQKVMEIKEQGYEDVINQLDLNEIKHKIVDNSTNPRDIRKLIELFIVNSVTEYILNV